MLAVYAKIYEWDTLRSEWYAHFYINGVRYDDSWDEETLLTAISRPMPIRSDVSQKKKKEKKEEAVTLIDLEITYRLNQTNI